MSFFYYDNIIRKYEEELNFTPIICHLENLFRISPNEDLLTTLIGASWYYYIEGNVNQLPVNYDQQLYLRKWKQYIEYGDKKFNESEKFCYIAGYTLSLHGFHIGKSYEKSGLILMKKCFEICTNKNLKIIAQNFIENEEIKINKKYKAIQNSQNICNELFPSNSMLDSYFKEMYLY